VVLDGIDRFAEGEPVFEPARSPTRHERDKALGQFSQPLLKRLTRPGHLVEFEGFSYPSDLNPDDPLAPLQVVSCTYRLAMETGAGHKVLSLRTMPDLQEDAGSDLSTDAHGFSLHAKVCRSAHERKELERVCRYITRPATANRRLECNVSGEVMLQPKSLWRDGTTYFKPSLLEFLRAWARRGFSSACSISNWNTAHSLASSSASLQPSSHRR